MPGGGNVTGAAGGSKRKLEVAGYACILPPYVQSDRPTFSHQHVRGVPWRRGRGGGGWLSGAASAGGGGHPAGSRPAAAGAERDHDAAQGGGSRARSSPGVFEGLTLGTPIAMLVRNTDARPGAYDEMRTLPAVARGLHVRREIRHPRLAWRRAGQRARDDRPGGGGGGGAEGPGGMVSGARDRRLCEIACMTSRRRSIRRR